MKRTLGILFYSTSIIVFSTFLVMLIAAFISWAIGLIFLFFMVLSSVFIVIIYISMTSLIRIAQNQPTLETRIRMLEGAIGLHDDTKG